ncbi:uncharacterized protein SCHCODRAFT_02666775 [Schizophyllum commune H4-8]|nr:uncharacterized protein SCHCODRAFT_02666775 [Schizophyllum commune H4-8]KAI5893691.1 hypothetical protein SCHCODRAFT_02666775 [Schizophyllum commune H4-8]
MSQARGLRTTSWEPSLSPVPSSLSGRSPEDNECGDSTEGNPLRSPPAVSDSESLNSRSESHGSDDDKNVSQSDDACASRNDNRQNARTSQDSEGGNQNDPSRLFGMPRYAPFYRGRGGLDDYKELYPEDPYGAEAGQNARVWRVYLDESAEFDSDMLRGYRDSLDVHLVFAALFSAVVTTFVVQTSQALQVDYGRITSALMLEMIALQRAGSPDQVASADIDLSTRSFSANDVLVNALFFASLSLSLSTTLMAVLLKQWLAEYSTVPPGSPRDRALIRQLRYQAFNKWKVHIIVGVVPSLLHISLGLFLLGLVFFVYTLAWPIFGIVLAIASATYAFYFGTHILALARWECPYRTPITFAIREIWLYCKTLYNRIAVPTRRIPLVASYRQFEMRAVRFTGQNVLADDSSVLELMHDGLMWLYQSAFNPTAQAIVIDTFAGMPSAANPARADYRAWVHEMIDALNGRFPLHVMSGKFDEQSLADFERSVRALSTLSNNESAREHLSFRTRRVLRAAEETILKQFDSNSELFGRLEVVSSVAYPDDWQSTGVGLFNTHLFHLDTDFRLSLPVWRSLIAHTFNIARIYTGAGAFERIVAIVHRRPALMESLLRIYRGRNTLDGFGAYRPYEGTATLGEVCHFHSDVKDQVTALLCKILDCDIIENTQITASLIDVSNCAGLAIPAWLFTSAHRTLQIKAQVLGDLHTSDERGGHVALANVLALFGIFTDRRTYSSVPSEIMQSWLNAHNAPHRPHALDNLYPLAVDDDPNPLNTLACLSIRRMLSMLDDFSFLPCLHRMPYDTHRTGIHGGNTLVLRAMIAYVRAALVTHFQGGMIGALNPLLTDDNVAFMVILCKSEFFSSADLPRHLNSAILEDRLHILERYEAVLHTLYFRTKSYKVWQRVFLTTRTALHSAMATRAVVHISPQHVSECRALVRFAQLICAHGSQDEQDTNLYLYVTVHWLNDLGIPPLRIQGYRMFGPYAIAFSAVNARLPGYSQKLHGSREVRRLGSASGTELSGDESDLGQMHANSPMTALPVDCLSRLILLSDIKFRQPLNITTKRTEDDPKVQGPGRPTIQLSSVFPNIRAEAHPDVGGSILCFTSPLIPFEVDDYSEIYPEDPYGAEAGENARVWRVYLDESGQFDEDMLRSYRDSLDVHLVFAALFSAVVTTFSVETAKSLQPDYSRISSALLLELVALQRAGSANAVPSADVDLNSQAFSAADVATNALFFASLSLSLCTTLVTVLLKQWLAVRSALGFLSHRGSDELVQEYAKVPPGSPRDRALIRHMRYQAMQRWKVPAIVGLVPSLLHISLGLFLLGLLVFLSGVSWPVFGVVAPFACTAYAFYVITHVLAITDWRCPYRTPVTFAIRWLLRLVMAIHSQVTSSMVVPTLVTYRQLEMRAVRFCSTSSPAQVTPELVALMHDGLYWLYQFALNPTAQTVVVESFAGLPAGPDERRDGHHSWIQDMFSLWAL